MYMLSSVNISVKPYVSNTSFVELYFNESVFSIYSGPLNSTALKNIEYFFCA